MTQLLTIMFLRLSSTRVGEIGAYSKRTILYKFVKLLGSLIRIHKHNGRHVAETENTQWELWTHRTSFSLVRIIEELLERKVAAPVYKTEINGRGDSLRWPRDTLYPLKLVLTSLTSGGRSVGIVRWRTEAPEFVFLFLLLSLPRLFFFLISPFLFFLSFFLLSSPF
jgi:hypothetical protein